MHHTTVRPHHILPILIAALLAACGPAAQPTPAEPEPVTQEPQAPTTEPATPAPSLFKPELVICAPGEPGDVYGPPTATGPALARLVAPPPVIYGPDYRAGAGGLLAALPSVEEGTLRQNDDGSITAVLAYRDDLVWSDGQPFSIDDAYLGLMASSYSDPSFPVIGVTVVDDRSLEVTLAPGTVYPYVPPQPPKRADAPGAGSFDGPTLGPYVRTTVEGADWLFSANPHYPGGVTIPQVRVRFIADAAQLAAEVAGGGCDVALDSGLGVAQLQPLLDAQAAGTLRVYTGGAPLIEQLILNSYTEPFTRAPLFADVRTRQAVAYALDRAALNAELVAGLLPLPDSWLPAEHWAYGPGVSYLLDAGQAAALLDQAGWSDSDGDGVRDYRGAGGEYACGRGSWSIAEGTPLAPVLIIPAGDDLRAALAERIRAALAPLGVKVQVQPVDPASYFSADGPLQRREFDMALLAGPALPDPDGISRWAGQEVFRHPLDLSVVYRAQLEERWLTTDQLVERLAYDNTPTAANGYQGQNYAGWCEDAANIAIVQASLGFDLEARRAAYVDQQAVLGREVPAVMLLQRPRIAAAAPYVCGIDLRPFEPLTWNIAGWTFDESEACSEQ